MLLSFPNSLCEMLMKGFYLGSTVFALISLLLQGPIQREAIGLPMNGLPATGFGFVCGLIVIMVAGTHKFWCTQSFRLGELPEWLWFDRVLHEKVIPEKSGKSSGPLLRPKSAPTKNLVLDAKVLKQSLLKTLNGKIPQLLKPSVTNLPEEFPCPYISEADPATK